MQNIQIRNNFVWLNTAIGRDDDFGLGMVDPGAKFTRRETCMKVKGH